MSLETPAHATDFRDCQSMTPPSDAPHARPTPAPCMPHDPDTRVLASSAPRPASFLVLIGVVAAISVTAQFSLSLPPILLCIIACLAIACGTALGYLSLRHLTPRRAALCFAASAGLCCASALASLSVHEAATGHPISFLAYALLASSWLFAATAAIWSLAELRRTQSQTDRELTQLVREAHERQATEEALRQAENRQNALLGAIPDLVLLMHKNGALSRYPLKKNRPSRTGTPSEIRRNSFRRQPFEDDPDLLRGVAYALERRGPQLFEYQAKMASDLLDVEVRVIPGKHNEALVILRDLTARRKLEREMLEASAREQRRIARDLHDGLGQELTGMLCFARGMAKKLGAENSRFAQEAEEMTRMLKESIVKTRSLAKGLRPVALEAMGLQTALKELADSTQELFGIPCSFAYDTDVVITEDAVAEHLYRIAQEAVTNAVKHADPTRIKVSLATEAGRLVLTVEDNGVGMQAGSERAKGLGLGIMKHRARIINGAIKFRAGAEGGAAVVCVWPSAKSDRDSESKDSERP